MSRTVNDWYSALYLKYEKERTWAARDLLTRIPDFDPLMIFDLGCGPANSTELLAARFVGVDTSEDMLIVARKRNIPSAQFQKQDIATWGPARLGSGLID